MLSGHGVARVAADVVLKPVGANKVVEVSVVTNDARGNGHFFNIQLWDSGAEVFAQNIVKGDLISFDFELRQERWEKDGEKKQKQVLRVKHFVKVVPCRREDGNAE